MKSWTLRACAAGILAWAFLSAAAAAAPAPEKPAAPAKVHGEDTTRVVKTDAEWKKLLSPEAYWILREQGTEPAFTGKYWKTKEPGMYHCICCGEPLFDSKTKYDSGSGWPSFYLPLDPTRVVEHSDTTYGMVRTEVRCAKCDAHLGHVFEDGPEPSGLRYCMNSAALDLKSAKK